MIDWLVTVPLSFLPLGLAWRHPCLLTLFSYNNITVDYALVVRPTAVAVRIAALPVRTSTTAPAAQQQ